MIFSLLLLLDTSFTLSAMKILQCSIFNWSARRWSIPARSWITVSTQRTKSAGEVATTVLILLATNISFHSLGIVSKSFGLSRTRFTFAYYSPLTKCITLLLNENGDKDTIQQKEEKFGVLPTICASFLRPQLTTSAKEILSSMLNTFSNNPFVQHHAQRYDQSVIMRTYDTEESIFREIIRPMSIADVLPGIYIIHSHTIYNLKHNDDLSLILNADSAYHGNEESWKSRV